MQDHFAGSEGIGHVDRQSPRTDPGDHDGPFGQVDEIRVGIEPRDADTLEIFERVRTGHAGVEECVAAVDAVPDRVRSRLGEPQVAGRVEVELAVLGHVLDEPLQRMAVDENASTGAHPGREPIGACGEKALIAGTADHDAGVGVEVDPVEVVYITDGGVSRVFRW